MASSYFCSETDKDAPEIQYLQRPIRHFEEKSKRFRKLIHQLVTHWFPLSQENDIEEQQFESLLGNSIIIWDDIVDESSLRQSMPTAHLIYGMPLTVRSISYGLNLMLSRSILINSKYVDIYIDDMINVTRGEAIEVAWRNRSMCPTEEQYLNDVIPKTDGIIHLAYKRREEGSETKLEDMSKGFTTLTQAFQIVNDYIDLKSSAYNACNDFCEDITAGTFSFPLIHAIKSHPEDDRIMNILKERTRDVEKKNICISILEEYGSFDYTKKRVQELVDMTREEFRKFPENLVLEKFLGWCILQLDPNEPMTPFYEI